VPFVDWKAKVELFEQLRREHEFGVGTIAGVASKFGVHRRVVRRAIASALPPAQHYPARIKPKLGVVADFIDKVLDEDLRAPRKQRHTARRIHRRILSESRSGTHTAQLGAWNRTQNPQCFYRIQLVRRLRPAHPFQPHARETPCALRQASAMSQEIPC
jgi:hypothetical protein